MNRKLEVSWFCLLLFFAGSSNLFGQETGYYVSRITGIKGGTLAPAGFYYIMHNVGYSANIYYGGNGRRLVASSVDVFFLF